MKTFRVIVNSEFPWNMKILQCEISIGLLVFLSFLRFVNYYLIKTLILY